MKRLMIVILALCVTACGDDRSDAEILAEKAENKRKGFHCLSGWDGSHRLFKKEVESQMRDPDSFEHISTRVSPISPKGTHIAIMKYRARNGFGGMTNETAVGGYFNDGCMHWIDSIN